MKNKLIYIFLFLFINSISYSNEENIQILNKKIKELNNNTSVLFISVRPTNEDHSLIAYFRYELGFKTHLAFLTNGESLIKDHNIETPAQFVANLREEAYNSSRYLDTDLYFFCLPDVSPITFEDSIIPLWDREYLISQILHLLKKYKPEIIILSRNDFNQEKNIYNEFLLDCFISVVRTHNLPASPHIFIYSESKKGSISLIDEVDKFEKSNLGEVIKNAKYSYKSLKHNIRYDSCGVRPIVQCVYPDKKIKDLYHLIKNINSSVNPEIRRDVINLSTLIKNNLKNIFESENTRKNLLNKLFELVQKIDQLLKSKISERSKYLLIRLKGSLEEIRCIVLETKIDYEVDEKILTNSQVTHLNIKSITSVNYNGNTQIIFPEVENGWIINESKERYHDYKGNEVYRMISPLRIDYHLPDYIYGIQRNELNYVFQFIIVHINDQKEYSFVKKENVHFKFAPRFSVELSKSVLAVSKDTILVFKLTNNSRDGISDYIYIDHPKVKSNQIKFSLNQKGSTFTDTLFIKWVEDIDESEFIVPVKIGGIVVENFLAKNIKVKSLIIKPIYYLKLYEESKILKLLNYLDIKPKIVASIDDIFDIENSIIVVGPEYLSHIDEEKVQKFFEEFSTKNNYFIIFPQNPGLWNRFYKFHNIILDREIHIKNPSLIDIDYTNKISYFPNKLEKDDFNNWEYRHGVNSITLLDAQNIEKLIYLKEIPLIFRNKFNSSKFIYINLDISAQFYNIDIGACKILANILAVE